MTQPPPSVEDVLQAVRASLDDDKALDMAVIPLVGKTSIADYMVVASGTSTRHVGSMADHVVEVVKKLGVPFAAVEGVPHCDWVLIDVGDVLVHLFRPEIANSMRWSGCGVPQRSPPAAPLPESRSSSGGIPH
ncbi:MAG: ribosome silencing factor [Rhodospirillales bacterium]|nr:ribosome silencing factor [Rhodospirillales bacterium]